MLPSVCPVCKHKPLKYDDGEVFCTNCSVYRKPLNILQRPIAWTIGRQWWWRLPILGLFIIMFKQILRNPESSGDRYGNPISAFNLGIHELGHMLFAPFGEFMHIAGGSIFQ